MFDAIIIGGGLAGMTTAAGLSRNGFNVCLLERNNKISKPSERTITLSEGSINFYKDIEVNLNISNAGQVDRIITTEYRGFGSVVFDASAVGLEHMGYVFRNDDIVLAIMDAYPGIDMRFNCQYQNIDSDHHGFMVGLSTGDTIKAKSLIFCEGANSKCFHLFDIGKYSKNYNQTALVFNIEHSIPHNNVAAEIFTPNGPVATLPLVQPDRSAVVWSQSEQLHMGFDEKTLDKDIGLYISDFLGDIKVTTPVLKFPLKLQIASNYYKDGVFLIGAVARNLHPLAGQGFNVILQDIKCLCNELRSWNASGDYSIKNLNSYAKRWRRKRAIGGFAMTAATDIINDAFISKKPILSLARNAALSITDVCAPLKKMFIKHSAGV